MEPALPNNKSSLKTASALIRQANDLLSDFSFDACRNQGNPNHFNSKRHPMYKDLLGDGSSLGIKFEYEIQKNPNGLGEALIIVGDFIGDGNVALILKDHIPEAQVHRNP